MRARDEAQRDPGVALVALLLSVVVGVGAAVGLSFGIVSSQSNPGPVKEPLVTYNAR